MVWAQDEPGDNDIYVPKSLDVNQLGSSPLNVVVKAVNENVLTGHQYAVEILYDPVEGPYWELINTTTATTLLTDQKTFNGEKSEAVEGLVVMVSLEGEDAYGTWEYTSVVPANLSPVAVIEQAYEGGRWFTGGNHGGDIFFGGVFLEPNFWGATTLSPTEYKPVEIRFRPMSSYTDLNSDGFYSIGEPYAVDIPLYSQKAFMYYSFSGDTYEGFFDIPFTVWDVSDPYNPRQLNVVMRDRDENHQWDLHYQAIPEDPSLPNYGDLRYNYVWILDTDYDPSGLSLIHI